MTPILAQIGSDLELLGIVVALVLFLLVFSAMVLYLAFRIKETFREGRGRGIVAAKVSFLVGVLFLAGTGLLFLAQALSSGAPTAGVGGIELNLSLSYPPQVQKASRFNMSFTVTNPSDSVAHGAAIEASILLQKFTVLSSSYPVTGSTISLGDVPKGTVLETLELSAPNTPGSVTDTVTLLFAEATAPPAQAITITVTGAP